MSNNRRWVVNDLTALITRIKLLDNIRKSLRGAKLVYHKLRYASLIAGNNQLKNIHSNRDFLILGNGLSLLDINLSSVDRFITFACNEFFQHPNFDKLNLNYYTVGEPFYGRVLGSKYIEDVIGLYGNIDCAFSKKKTVHLYHATLKNFFEHQNLLPEHEKYFYVSSGLIRDEVVQTHDLERPISLADGAIYLMIAASIHMGARTIYLAGCGYTYTPVQELHFYDAPSIPLSFSHDEKQSRESKIMARYQDMHVRKDKIHDGKQYYSVSRNVEGRHYHNYEIIKNYADGLGVRIVNIVPTHFLSPVFDGICLEEFGRICGLEKPHHSPVKAGGLAE